MTGGVNGTHGGDYVPQPHPLAAALAEWLAGAQPRSVELRHADRYLFIDSDGYQAMWHEDDGHVVAQGGAPPLDIPRCLRWLETGEP